MLGKYVAALVAALVVADGAWAAKRARSATSGGGGSAPKAKSARSATGSNTARAAGGAARAAATRSGAQAESPDTGGGQARASSKGTGGTSTTSASDLFFKTEMLRATLEDIATGVRKFWSANASRKNLDLPDNVAFLKQGLRDRSVSITDPWGNDVDFAGNGYITLKVNNLNRAHCVYIKNTIKGGQYPTQANSIGSTDFSTEGGCQDKPDNIVSVYYKQNS